MASVGAAVGWADPSQFSRRFRAVFGVSPREYRRRVRDGHGHAPIAEADRFGRAGLLAKRNSAQEHVNPRQARRACLADRDGHPAGSRARPAGVPSGSPSLPALGGAPHGHISDPDRGARAACRARRHGVRRRLRRCLADHRTAPTAATDAPSAQATEAASPSEAAAEAVTLNWFVDDNNVTQARLQGLIDAYTKLHPNVTITIETHPGGTEGDNLVKTRLATGDMPDIFYYNSGSLLQALNPAETLVDLSGEPFVANLQESYLPTVSAGGKIVRRPDRGHPRRRHPLQQEDLQRPRPPGPQDVGRVRGQQREDQGGRQGGPGVRHVRRHLDLAAVRPRRLLQRRRSPTRRSRPTTPPTRRTTPTRPPPRPGSSTCRRRSRRAGGRRTSAPTSSRRAAEAGRGQGRPLPDADLRRRDHGHELPRPDRRHRLLRPAGRRRGDERLHDLDAGRHLHPQDHDRRTAGRGQGVPGLHRHGRRLQRA